MAGSIRFLAMLLVGKLKLLVEKSKLLVEKSKLLVEKSASNLDFREIQSDKRE